MKKSAVKTKQIVNRRASFDYKLGDKLITGMVLAGSEVRAARDGHVSLKGAFVTIRNHELWLNNASFTLKNLKDGGNTVSTEPRKLLATKRQIEELLSQKKSGLTIVPTKMLTYGRHIKLEIAVGAGKKLHDKRHDIKKRDLEREARKFIS